MPVREAKASLELVERYSKQLGEFFSLKGEPASRRLTGLLAEARTGAHPGIVAENIGSTLRDELNAVRGLPSDDRLHLLEDIIKGLLMCLDKVHRVWKDNFAYLMHVNEIWIAYEPTLDLLLEEDGAYGLLKKQLRHCERVVFFQSDGLYFRELKFVLADDSSISPEDVAKLRFHQIDEPLVTPIALYLGASSKLAGFQAKYPPPITRNQNGKYQMKDGLPDDWMSYLKRQQASAKFEELSRYTSRNGD